MPEQSTPYPIPDTLVSVDVVLAQLLNSAGQYPDTEQLPLNLALNRVLAQDIESPETVPPFDNSAVDGYAIRASDANQGLTLPVSQRIPAGHAPEALRSGSAARIFTGATVPAGADTIVMQEDVSILDNGQLRFNLPVKAGQNIRQAGQDIKRGETVLFRGQHLNPQSLGMLASIGLPEVSVFRPLRVAFLSTGDELVEPGQPLQAGQIFNSNRYLLHGLLTQLNFELVDLGVVPDTLAATTEALRRGADQADVILTTGGASVGEEDHIQAALRQGGQMDLWRVAIKPGKPFMYGQFGSTPVLGLPGNPSAVFITFLILARPYLLRRQGKRNVLPKALRLPSTFSQLKPGKRREYLRVRLDESGRIIKHPNQSSGMLSSAAWAEGLAVVPENRVVNEGDLLDYYPFSHLFTFGD